MKRPKLYNLTPARGQALLNFQGRLYPDKVEQFETQLIEQVRQQKKRVVSRTKQADMHADFTNLVIHGDCLSACAYLKSKNIKVDLVYIDPPFASGANYAKTIYVRTGGKSKIENADNSIGEEIMYGDIWQKEDYLNWLYERLLAINDVMGETGSIFVHLDWHIGHYGKILLDEVFGEENFVNEVIWRYEGPQSPSNYKFATKHETIFRYAKGGKPFVNELWYFIKIPESEANFKKDESGRWFFTIPKGDYSQKSIKKLDKEGKIFRGKTGNIRIKCFVEKTKDGSFLQRKKIPDVWSDIPSLGLVASKGEVANYTTQKPEGLLKRITKASSDKGMLVADFFVGSGTAAKVANDLGRKFIACDIGVNAIQNTRDRLVKAGAEFDALKINDGVRLFRNPAQTTQKMFSLIDGFKNRTDLELGEFWEGGIVNEKGAYTPVKFVGIHERLTKKLVDVILEEVYRLEDTSENAEGVKLLYAHKDIDIDQEYVNKEIRNSGKTTLKVELVSLDQLLGQNAESLFTPDNADITIKKQSNHYRVTIKRYFSSYLKNKVDDFNARKVKMKSGKFTAIKISKKGLELIESVQFDTTLRKDGVWVSNLELEDKAGIKEKIKGSYSLETDKFRMKIRNIAGDEIVIDSNELHE